MGGGYSFIHSFIHEAICCGRIPGMNWSNPGCLSAVEKAHVVDN